MPLLSMAVMLVYRALLCGSRKYPYLPHRRDRIFQGGGGGGGSIWLIFQWGGGVHHREIFPEGSCDGFESNKEKTQKFTMTIYLRRWSTPHENRKNDHF